ncbi:MAG: dihydropteroate synthase [Nitrospirae bacterium]|nr:dihydropteroate synthase [Nitrospirota bacterium]
MKAHKTAASGRSIWKVIDQVLTWGPRPLVMGVLNVTPDSFSDGGRFLEPSVAIDHALKMVAEGANVIDVGGESSRPGAEPVEVSEELQRVIPVMEALARAIAVPLSVDTTKAEVARQAVRSGASIINDISALRWDPAMRRVAAETGAGVILMHMQGAPKTMQRAPEYADVVREVKNFLISSLREATKSGIEPERILLDPGIGFGKNLQQNLTLLAELGSLAEIGRPLCVGVSRKSFIGAVTDAALPDRLPGSLAAAVVAMINGARLLRVHDVPETVAALNMATAILEHRVEKEVS